MIPRIWRLSETSAPNNLGLACTDQGLLLGRTPLIERRHGRFVVRERSEIERLLSHAYRTIFSAGRIMPGLATVAAALNADDQCLARIAAVHLRLPDLPDRAARDGMEAMDVLLKSARDESGGDTWNPALHPRAGTPPIPDGLRRRMTVGRPRHEPHKTTTRRIAPMPRQVQVRIGSDCEPDQNASTSLPTSPSGSPTRRLRMRTRSARKSKDITQTSAGTRRLTISTQN
jgi:hypothetical protein